MCCAESGGAARQADNERTRGGRAGDEEGQSLSARTRAKADSAAAFGVESFDVIAPAKRPANGVGVWAVGRGRGSA